MGLSRQAMPRAGEPAGTTPTIRNRDVRGPSGSFHVIVRAVRNPVASAIALSGALRGGDPFVRSGTSGVWIAALAGVEPLTSSM